MGRSIRRHRAGTAVLCLAVTALTTLGGGVAGAAAQGQITPTAGYLLQQPSPLALPAPCGETTLEAPVVGAIGLANGGGGWQVSSDGGVFSCGSARYYGSVAGLQLHLAGPIAGMAATPDDRGYWLFGSDGGVFAFGDARYEGGAATVHLNAPIVGMVSDGAGDGYWLVASDGGVFAYGRAAFGGSLGSRQLNAPIRGIASSGSQGYWLVAADGGVFAFGGAPFHGSAASLHLSAPVVGMTPAPDGKGYWLVAADGGVFAYGSARFDPHVSPMYGTPVGVAPVNPVIALLPGTGDSSYSLVAAAPAVEPGVPGRSGYDLARREFALDLDLQALPPETGGESSLAIQSDLWQAAQYLLLDGTANGASASAVDTCVAELDQFQQDIAAFAYGRDAPSAASVIALAGQISAFFGLTTNPYQGI